MKFTQCLAVVQLVLLSCFVPSQLNAQHSGTTIIENLEPVLDCQTIFVANIPLEEFQFDTSTQELITTIGDVPAEVARKVKIRSEFTQKILGRITKAGAIDVNVIGRLGTLIEQERLIVIRCNNEAAAAKISERIDRLNTSLPDSVVKQNLVLFGWDDAFLKLPRIEKEQLITFAKSLDEVHDSPIRLALTLSPDQKKALLAGDVKHWGGETAASINNFQKLAVGFDIIGRRVDVKLQCADSESSKAIAKRIDELLDSIAFSRGIKRNLPSMSKWLGNIELPISNDTIGFKVEGDQFDTMVKALSRPLIQAIKRQTYSEEIARAREIAIGFLSYEEEHGTLPPPFSTDEKGKPMHSWRVLILPYINQRNLYNRFRMSEPWNSEHNLEVAKLVPVNYMVNDEKLVDGMLHTRIVALVGENSAIRGKKTTISQITDGTVNTISIAVGSTKNAIPWTKPEDVTGEPKAIAKKLMSENPNGFWVATCDSGVHFVPPKSDLEKLAWALQINDGNLLSPNGDRLAEIFAGPNAPDPLYDPSRIIPRWWTDYLVPVPWIQVSAMSSD